MRSHDGKTWNDEKAEPSLGRSVLLSRWLCSCSTYKPNKSSPMHTRTTQNHNLALTRRNAARSFLMRGMFGVPAGRLVGCLLMWGQVGGP